MSAGDRVRVSAREGGDARCPYCHDAIGDVLRSAACAGCELVAHVDCWIALAKCPALGCGREAPAPPPEAPAPAPLPTSFTVGGTTTVTLPPSRPAAGRRGRRRERQRRDHRPEQAPAWTEVRPPDRTAGAKEPPAILIVLMLVIMGLGAIAGIWLLVGDGTFGTHDVFTSRAIGAGACFLAVAVAALAAVGVAIWRHLTRPPS